MLAGLLFLVVLLFGWLPAVSFSVGVLMRYSKPYSSFGLHTVVFTLYLIFFIAPTAYVAFSAYDETRTGLVGKIVNAVFALPAVLAIAPLWVGMEGLGYVLEPYWNFDFSEVSL
jgi:hypothetical protein